MSEEVKAALRFAIVSVARVQAWAGAHYLNTTVATRRATPAATNPAA
jgi:hypothetical protein